MATASVSITPECSICCENLKTPKVLACGHTFCYECIDRYIGDKKETFLCPICGQGIKIPDGGAKMFITNFILQTSPQQVTSKTSPTTQVTGTPTSSTTQVTNTSHQLSEITNHHCPNHSKKEVEYYCQTCSLGLCSKCIYRDHNDHKTLDLECDSTRAMVVEELTKSEQFLKNIIEDLEKVYATLIETSEKLKSLKVNCEKIQTEIRDNFDKNESQLTETRQKVMSQIKNIMIDLDSSCLISLNKLKDLQKLCENMKTDIPPVTYVECREESVDVCDILGSTVTKPLYQTRKGCGPILTDTDLLYGKIFICDYKDIRREVPYYSEDKYEKGEVVWSCRVVRYNRCLYIGIGLLPEDNLQNREQNKRYKTEYTLVLLNEDKDKNVVSRHGTCNVEFYIGHLPDVKYSEIQIPLTKLTDPSEGFIDNEGQFYVRCDITSVYSMTLDNHEQLMLSRYGI